MREILTKPIEDGEHVLIDGVEYVAEHHGNNCSGCAFYGGHDCDNIPCQSFIMRKVEKQPTYRPYKNTDEMIEDFKKRFNVEVPQYSMPMIWVKHKGTNVLGLVSEFGVCSVVRIFDAGRSMNELFGSYTYLDGSPCGRKEE